MIINSNIEVICKETVIKKSFTGELEINTIINSWIEIVELYRTYRINKCLLLDYCNTKISFTRSDKDLFIAFALLKKECFKNLKIGILTSDPTSTCFFLLIQGEIFRKVGCDLKVFSTEKAALKWILKSNLQ